LSYDAKYTSFLHANTIILSTLSNFTSNTSERGPLPDAINESSLLPYPRVPSALSISYTTIQWSESIPTATNFEPSFEKLIYDTPYLIIPLNVALLTEPTSHTHIIGSLPT